MLELAILGLLKESPMHGYDLRKRLRSDFGLLSSLSFGSLYPALSRLQASGAVRMTDQSQAANAPQRRAPETPDRAVIPFTGSLSGERAAFRARLAARAAGQVPARAAKPKGVGTRSRKVYELTPRGEQLFEEMLAEEPGPSEDGRGFSLRWLFARYLPSEARLKLLGRRRRQLEDRLDDVERRAAQPPRPLDRFERSLLEHSSAQIRFELEWIDRLIATEREALVPESETGVS
jgi:DNA-binding PadR family transcriptional regulator